MNNNAFFMKLRPTKVTTLAATLITFGSLAGAANAVSLLLFEDFEASSSARVGVGYTSNKIGTTAMPIRAQGTDPEDRYGSFTLAELSPATTGVSYGNIQGSYFLSVEDHNFDGSASDLTVTWSGIDISSVVGDLMYSFYLAEDTAPDGFEDWDVGDSFIIETQFDGAGFSRVFAVEDQGSGSTAPRVDTDLNGVGDGDLITDTFTRFEVSESSGSANTLDLRITFTGLTVTGEDLAFDSLSVTGTQVPEPSTAFVLSIGVLGFISRRMRAS